MNEIEYRRFNTIITTFGRLELKQKLANSQANGVCVGGGGGVGNHGIAEGRN